MCRKLNRLIALPNRLFARIDKDDPISTASRIDVFSIVARCTTEILEPYFTCARRLTDDPKNAESSTEMLLPNLAVVKTLIFDPNLTHCLNDSVDPRWH
jgi:hypothetical protein